MPGLLLQQLPDRLSATVIERCPERPQRHVARDTRRANARRLRAHGRLALHLGRLLGVGGHVACCGSGLLPVLALGFLPGAVIKTCTHV